MNSQLQRLPEIKAIGDGQVCIVPYSSIKDLEYGFHSVDSNAMSVLASLKRCRFMPYDSYGAVQSCTEIMLVAKIVIDSENSCLINNNHDDNLLLCFSEAIRIRDGCFSPISNPYRNCAKRIKIPIDLHKDMLNDISMHYLKDYNTDYFFVAYVIKLNKAFADVLGDEQKENAFISATKLDKCYSSLSYIDKIIATEILYNEYHQ